MARLSVNGSRATTPDRSKTVFVFMVVIALLAGLAGFATGVGVGKGKSNRDRFGRQDKKELDVRRSAHANLNYLAAQNAASDPFAVIVMDELRSTETHIREELDR